MNDLTRGIPGVEVYQDDVIVHASSKSVHDSQLLQLFRKFCEHNVAVNPKKCSFSVSNFECYVVDGTGYKPDPNRLKPLAKACSPTNIHELRSLVGALQYYSRFIPNFSSRASPLFLLLSSDNFVWSGVHERCLRDILSFLQSEAVLRPFSPRNSSVLITDASPEGIGAVLEQNGHPVVCVSRRLTPAEQAMHKPIVKLWRYIGPSSVSINTYLDILLLL